MKRFVGVAVGVFALLMFVGAAQSASINTAKGTTSLVFQWSGLSNLNVGTYKGGVGVRHYLQDGLAIRPGVQLGVSSEKDESQDPNMTDDKYSEVALGLDVVLEKHKDIGINSLSPWIGVGAGFSLFSSTDEPSVASSSPPNGTLTKTEESFFGFRAYVGAGFEASVADGVTLGANYQAGVSISSGEEKETRAGQGTNTTSKGSAFGFGFNAMSLYLSVRIM